MTKQTLDPALVPGLLARLRDALRRRNRSPYTFLVARHGEGFRIHVAPRFRLGGDRMPTEAGSVLRRLLALRKSPPALGYTFEEERLPVVTKAAEKGLVEL